MATGSGGGGGAGGGGPSGGASGSTGAGPGASAAVQGRVGNAAPTNAGDIEVLGADGKSQGVFNDGKPVAPNIRLESLDRSPNGKVGAGIPLKSFGKGASAADFDAKTNEVVIRRSGRVVERLADDQAVTDYAAARKLSGADREMFARLSALRSLEPAARAEARQALNDRTPAREPELINVVGAAADKGSIRAEVERNDAEVFARVEAMKKAREAAKANRPVEPLEPIPRRSRPPALRRPPRHEATTRSPARHLSPRPTRRSASSRP